MKLPATRSGSGGGRLDHVDEGGLVADPLEVRVVRRLVPQRRLGAARVESGVFGARMLVEIENAGPVTIVLDTAEL